VYIKEVETMTAETQQVRLPVIDVDAADKLSTEWAEKVKTSTLKRSDIFRAGIQAKRAELARKAK
jgi:hypothetical protein